MNNGAEKLSMAEVLSALADGEGDRESIAAVTALWRDDAALRARWHGYQLIGDALRSDELAGHGRDADFVRRLRERLDREPVVLAPQRPAEAPQVRVAAVAGSRARRWASPAAMAAGFVMVAGAVFVTRTPTTSTAEPVVSRAMPAAPSTVVVAAEPSLPPTGAAGPTAVAARTADAAAAVPGVLLRDPRMQQYFAAHQQFGGSTALGLPSAFLRNATFDTPAEAAGSR